MNIYKPTLTELIWSHNNSLQIQTELILEKQYGFNRDCHTVLSVCVYVMTLGTLT